MQTLKDILVITWILIDIGIFVLAIVASINGWIFTAFFSWAAEIALCYLYLPRGGGMGSYDRDF